MSLPLATSTWDEEEYAAIQRVIDSDRFSMGLKLKRLRSSSLNSLVQNTPSCRTLDHLRIFLQLQG